MNLEEAAGILGTDTDTVKKWQRSGSIPDPIPDDYFDAVINFRVQIEQAFRRRIDRSRGIASEED